MYAQYSTEEFEKSFTYSGKDLGANWHPEHTFFRLWAPTAQEVSVCLYQTGTQGQDDLIEKLPMSASEKGTWTATALGDLNGVYYTYQVCVAGKTVEACDPYAVASGVNGKRAMICNLRSTDPVGWEQDTTPIPVSYTHLTLPTKA